MPTYMPIANTKEAEIEAAIKDIAARLRPDVVRIRYEIAEDWSGDWGIFFRVTLSDKASSPRRLHDVTTRVVESVSKAMDFPALGVFPYFNFRSLSEQKTSREEAWA
jgi:hypothetical protein